MIEVLPDRKIITHKRAIEEAIQAATSFDYFCDNFAYIEDKENRRAIRFDRYQCQRDISKMLVEGEWLVILKARQLGITWLLAVYTLWCLMTKPMFDACVLQQNKDYAKDFLNRIRFVYEFLPDYVKIPMKSDSLYEITFWHGTGRGSRLRVLAGSDASGRSLTANLIVFDEHAYIPSAKESREGCEPALEQSKGQAVIISTSRGPYGDFYDVWQGAPGNKFIPVFLKWSDHPGRDKAWYEDRVEQHKNTPLFVKREYPETPEEAFMFAEGRCFPAFTYETHVRNRHDIGFDWESADLYRAVDFGHVRPYACIWIAHFPDAMPGLTVDASCENTIRELLAYHFDDKAGITYKERPAKMDDHTCFVAGTKIETIDGPKSIEMVQSGDLVRSHRGWCYATSSAMKTTSEPCVRVTLEDGTLIVCTGDHPFALEEGGWLRADALSGHKVCRWSGDHGRRRIELAKRRAAHGVPLPTKEEEIQYQQAKGCRRGPVLVRTWDIVDEPETSRSLPSLGMEEVEVVSVEALQKSLEVYSFATEHGSHLANGILVSNCDALRYATSFFDMRGHVHIYRELYVVDSVGKGRTDMHDIADIQEMSGWIEAPEWDERSYVPGPDAEHFMGTVTDRNLPKTVELYNEHGIYSEGYSQHEDDVQGDEIMGGIRRLNILMDGTKEITKRVVLTDEQRREQDIRRHRVGRTRGTTSLQQAAIYDITKEKMNARTKDLARQSRRSRQNPVGR